MPKKLGEIHISQLITIFGIQFFFSPALEFYTDFKFSLTSKCHPSSRIFSDVYIDVPDTIDITHMRSKGMQPGEELLPESGRRL